MNFRKIQPSSCLAGTITVPGDKSITHRAVIMASLSHGETVIRDPLKSVDCIDCLRAFQAMGVNARESRDAITITGKGKQLTQPSDPLWFGNSGTAMRLLSGVLSGQGFSAQLTGDEFLSKRPMKRIAVPLEMMGASVTGRGERCMPPLDIAGGSLRGIDYTLPVASAQVKSCILLASLYGSGGTRITEPAPTRDHTERIFETFGIVLDRQYPVVSLDCGQDPKTPGLIAVPGDFSSAFFIICAAALLKGSHIILQKVGINPTRIAALDVLKSMGADVTLHSIKTSNYGSEPVADMEVSYSGRLKGAEIKGSVIPNLIDELPMFCFLGLFCDGVLSIRDAGELRVKETDRIKTVVQNLVRLDADFTEYEDGIDIKGSSDGYLGTEFNSFGDHRIAMASAVAALAHDGPSTVMDTACIDTSFPGFFELLEKVSIRS